MKLELILRGRRLKKRKTEMRKRTLNPVFNESHIFDVPNADLQQVVLLVTVLDYDRCAVADAVPLGLTLPSLFSKREVFSGLLAAGTIGRPSDRLYIELTRAAKTCVLCETF